MVGCFEARDGFAALYRNTRYDLADARWLNCFGLLHRTGAKGARRRPLRDQRLAGKRDAMARYLARASGGFA
jgi:hypothetical protein